MAVKSNIFLKSDNLVEITGLRNAQTGDYINENGVTVTMSLYKQVPKYLDQPILAYTLGGTYEIQVGDVVEGKTSNAWGIVGAITLTSGTWAGEDAAGNIYLTCQTGTFQAAEKLGVGTDVDVATAAGDSVGGKAISAAGGAKTQLPITSHGLPSDVKIRIEGTKTVDGEWDIDSVDSVNLITINTAYAAEVFDGRQAMYEGIKDGTAIAMSYVAASDGNWYGTIPDTIKKIYEGEYLNLFIEVVKAGENLMVQLPCEVQFYPIG